MTLSSPMPISMISFSSTLIESNAESIENRSLSTLVKGALLCPSMAKAVGNLVPVAVGQGEAIAAFVVAALDVGLSLQEGLTRAADHDGQLGLVDHALATRKTKVMGMTTVADHSSSMVNVLEVIIAHMNMWRVGVTDRDLPALQRARASFRRKLHIPRTGHAFTT